MNRASEIHAFTWTLEIAAMTFVIARMYSRIKLTHNVWWDDYIICLAWVLSSYLDDLPNTPVPFPY